MAKQCYFCTNNIKEVDYKNVGVLKKFLDNFAKILPRRETGLCAKHQKDLARAVKRARFMALVPYQGEGNA